MARRPQAKDPKIIRQRLVALLERFEQHLDDSDLREQVLALVPAVHLVRELGSSLIHVVDVTSARGRILHYMQRYPFTVISGDELAVVSGISEYARRVRELRVEHGWPIYSGRTAKEMVSEESAVGGQSIFGPELTDDSVQAMSPDDYILVGDQDRDAAHRWVLANDIRKSRLSLQDRLLKYLRMNVGVPVTGEELRYVAKGKQSWPRRVRELRTEEGWPIATRNTGGIDLPVGVYVLEADRRSEPHDRHIPDSVRVTVLQRDRFRCRCCAWEPGAYTKGDPRSLLELHHVEYHAGGGSNDPNNLVTLCNVHHDDVHRKKVKGGKAFAGWLSDNCK